MQIVDGYAVGIYKFIKNRLTNEDWLIYRQRIVVVLALECLSAVLVCVYYFKHSSSIRTTLYSLLEVCTHTEQET